MKIICLLAVLFVSCSSHIQSNDHVKNILPIGSKQWNAERLTEYRGDYRAEEFAGSLSLHLRAYFDDHDKAIRYAACLIVAEDVASKPSIETWFDLHVTKAGIAKTKTESPLFVPVILADGSRGVLVRGLVLKPFDRH